MASPLNNYQPLIFKIYSYQIRWLESEFHPMVTSDCNSNICLHLKRQENKSVCTITAWELVPGTLAELASCCRLNFFQSAFKEFVKCRGDLCNHVWSGHRTVMLLKGLVVALSRQCTCSKCSYKGGIYPGGGGRAGVTVRPCRDKHLSNATQHSARMVLDSPGIWNCFSRPWKSLDLS